MQPPPSLCVESNKVCRIRCALYGLKQASRAWFAKSSSTISRLGYMANHYDLPYFFVALTKALFYFSYMWMI